MGSGKSHFLKKAKTWGFETIDLDDEVFKQEESSFSSLGEYIRSEGWESFRTKEAETLQKLILRKRRNSVFIALGGGTLDRYETRELLEHRDDIETIWLNTSFEECLRRTVNDKNRPQLDKSENELRELYTSRLKYFSKAKVCLTPNDADALIHVSDFERKLD